MTLLLHLLSLWPGPHSVTQLAKLSGLQVTGRGPWESYGRARVPEGAGAGQDNGSHAAEAIKPPSGFRRAPK